MDFVIEYGGEPQDVTVTVSGIADVAGLGRVNAELRTDPRFRSGLALLYDLTELDVSHLSDRDLERITAPITERDWDAPPGPVALLVSGQEAVERTRLAIAHLGGTRSRRRIFTSHEAAVAWLRKQRS